MKKSLFFIVCTLGFIFFAFPQEDAKKKTSTVTIEKAEKTEYLKDEKTGEETIVFKGNVLLSVESGADKTKISASLVRFNRKQNMLYAEGAVVLEKTTASQPAERIDADAILFNIDSLEGVFDEVRVEQEKLSALQLPAGSKLIVYADLLAKDKASTIAFDKGKLTFCSDEEEPHWQLKASKIWLLPGNEFAFFNALLYVGNVPLFYFPFFYYPKDELIFNPVFGYSEREGYFLQTTTYFVGRKNLEVKKQADKTDKTQSTETIEELFNFLKPTTLKEQERRGLFLHNLETDAKDVSSDYLKFMADYYSDLGAYIGIKGYFSPNQFVKKIDFGFGLGFSRSFFPNSPVPTINPTTGERVWDEGFLFANSLPFRFYEEFSLSLSKPSFSFSLSLPFYSDPYFNADFHNRSEDMDWINYFLNNTLMTAPSLQANPVALSSFNWNLNLSYSPKIDFIKPYINTFSLSDLSFSVDFITKQHAEKTSLEFIHDINRQFYIPSQIKPVDANMKLSGTLFSYPFAQKIKNTKQDIEDIFLFAPKAEDFSEEKKQEADKNEIEIENKEIVSEDLQNQVIMNQVVSEDLDEVAKELTAVKLNPTKLTKSAFTLFSYSLSYDLSSSLKTLVLLNSSEINTPEDMTASFSNLQSTYFQLRSPLNLRSKATFINAIFQMNNTFSFIPQIQDHPFISEEYYTNQVDIDKIKLNDLAENKFDITNKNSLSVNPFLSHAVFKNTSLTWNLDIRLLKKEFTGTLEEPLWSYIYPEWDKESIRVHNLAFLLSLDEGIFAQKLSFSLSLPPTTESYGTKLSLVFPLLTTSFETSIKKDLKTEEYRFDPFFQTAQLKVFNNSVTLDQNYKYDIEEKRSTSFYTGLSYASFSMRYSMLYTNLYKLTENGWLSTDEKDFIPFDLRFSFSKTNLSWSFWKNRISINPGLSTSFTMDLVRPTNSYFNFSPSLSFSIYNFLKITFSSESTNNLVFRYFQNFYGYDFKVPGETNIFIDLLKSFDFMNEKNRMESAFKLQKLSLKIEHDLHDWTLKSEFSFSPRLITKTSPYYYDFSPYFSLSVVWNPLKSLKTEIVDEYGTFQLNP